MKRGMSLPFSASLLYFTFELEYNFHHSEDEEMVKCLCSTHAVVELSEWKEWRGKMKWKLYLAGIGWVVYRGWSENGYNISLSQMEVCQPCSISSFNQIPYYYFAELVLLRFGLGDCMDALVRFWFVLSWRSARPIPCYTNHSFSRSFCLKTFPFLQNHEFLSSRGKHLSLLRLTWNKMKFLLHLNAYT